MGTSSSKHQTTNAIADTSLDNNKVAQWSQLENDEPPTVSFQSLSNDQFDFFTRHLTQVHCGQLYQAYQNELSKKKGTSHKNVADDDLLLDLQTIYHICNMYYLDNQFHRCLNKQENVTVKQMEDAVQKLISDDGARDRVYKDRSFESMGYCTKENMPLIRLVRARRQELDENPSLLQETFELIEKKAADSLNEQGVSQLEDQLCASYKQMNDFFQNDTKNNVLYQQFAKEQLEKCLLAVNKAKKQL